LQFVSRDGDFEGLYCWVYDTSQRFQIDWALNSDVRQLSSQAPVWSSSGKEDGVAEYLTRWAENEETIADHNNGEELLSVRMRDGTIEKNKIGLVKRRAKRDQAPVMATSRRRIFRPPPMNTEMTIHA